MKAVMNKYMIKTINTVLRRDYIGKTKEGIIFLEKRNFPRAKFDTEEGVKVVNIDLCTVSVDNGIKRIEVIVGTSFFAASRIAYKLAKSRVPFRNVAEVLESQCDYDAIDRAVAVLEHQWFPHWPKELLNK